jgi:hypothetical protein
MTVWYLVAAIGLALPALLVDGVLVAVSGSGWGMALAAGVAAAGLALVSAALLAPLLALGAAGVRWLGRWPRLARFWHVGTFPAALALCWAICEPTRRRAFGAYLAIAGLGALALTLAAWLSRARTAHLAALAALLLAAVAVALNVLLASTMYLELHALGLLITTAGLLSAAAQLRGRLRRVPGGHLLAGGLLVLGIGVFALGIVDRVRPSWRRVSFQHGRHAYHTTRALWTVVDLDRDGFSAVAWGTDCDDLDADRHPLAQDRPGRGDANCNGIDPPRHPVPAQRGLAPERGSPALASGAVDLLLLVIIDALRADALTDELMPKLTRAMKGAARFDRAYAGATATAASVPLMHIPAAGARPVARTLVERGIAVEAVSSAYLEFARYGFDHAALVDKDAAKLTDKALQTIQAASGKRSFVLLHYMDVHSAGPPALAVTPPDVRHELSPRYRSGIAYVDEALGELFGRLGERVDTARTAVLLTSDHGEGFGEGGVYHHGRGADDAVIHVPLLVVGPGLKPGHYRQLVSHRDLPATILGAFGLAEAARAAERFGRSLWRLRATPNAALHRFVVTRSARYASGTTLDVPTGVMVGPRYKLAVSYTEGIFELYRRADAWRFANRDLLDREPTLAARMWRKLALFSDLDGYPASFRQSDIIGLIKPGWKPQPPPSGIVTP